MNLQENIRRILKSIAKKIANKLHCDRHGSCIHFAEIFVDEVNKQYPELLNDFEVIEGYVNVKFGDGIPQEHTWIRLSNGDIIDPTFSQFDKYDKNAQYSKKRTKVYSGQEYYDEGKDGSWFSERRKKLPSSVFKKGLQESIRRILKEETNKPSENEFKQALKDVMALIPLISHRILHDENMEHNKENMAKLNEIILQKVKEGNDEILDEMWELAGSKIIKNAINIITFYTK